MVSCFDFFVSLGVLVYISFGCFRYSVVVVIDCLLRSCVVYLLDGGGC